MATGNDENRYLSGDNAAMEDMKNQRKRTRDKKNAGPITKASHEEANDEELTQGQDQEKEEIAQANKKKKKKKKRENEEEENEELKGKTISFEELEGMEMIMKKEAKKNASGIMTTKAFSTQLWVSKAIVKALEDMDVLYMTKIQARAIPDLILGIDVLVAAMPRGSEKTFAFLIPAVSRLHRMGFKPRDGTGVIVICPTRHLAIKTYALAKELMKYQRQTVGLVFDGAPRRRRIREAAQLARVNVLVATPRRLLYHIQNTKRFKYKRVLCLVIDEADKILEANFEKEMEQIMKILPENYWGFPRQTALFCAAITKQVEDLAHLSFHTNPDFYPCG